MLEFHFIHSFRLDVHYAAISGTLDNLTFLVESGGKVSKDMSKIPNGLNLCDEYGLAEVK